MSLYIAFVILSPVAEQNICVRITERSTNKCVSVQFDLGFGECWNFVKMIVFGFLNMLHS